MFIFTPTVQITKTDNNFSYKIELIKLTFNISSRRTDLISKSSKLQIYPEVCIGSLKLNKLQRNELVFYLIKS